MTWLLLLLPRALVVAGNVVLLPFFAYLFALAAAALAYRRRRPADTTAPGLPRFLWVVPAHDEEANVAATVRSCLAADYPRDRFDIIVIADNCSDGTARAAREAGARAVERHDPVKKSKGYALEYLFGRLRESGEDARYDAVVVVDADTVVDRDLLAHFAASLKEGRDWLQCYYTAANPDRSWRTRLMTHAFSLFNGVWPMGQERFGLSAAMRGNGMVFSTAGLRRFPWRAYGLTEDLEFSWLLRVGGERVHFVPEAAVRGEMVSGGGPSAASQRQRWEVGRRDLRKALTAPLWKSPHFGLGKKLVYLVDLYCPPLVRLVALLTVVSVVNLLVFHGTWLRVNLIVDLFMFAALVLYVLSPFVALRLPWRYAADLAYVPFYAFWKLTVALRKKPTGWVRTQREKVGR